MAEIVVLNTWRSEKRQRPEIRIGNPRDEASILLFTGVRYERYDRFDDRRDGGGENQAARAD